MLRTWPLPSNPKCARSPNVRRVAEVLLTAIACSVAFSPQASAQGRVDVTDLDGEVESVAPAQTEQEPSRFPIRARSSNGVVGRKAAQKYMGQAGKPEEKAETIPAPARAPAGASEAHYLALHVGGFLSDNAYKWGARDSAENVGKLNLGLTYRMGEWKNSMDLGLRVDFQTFGLADGGTSKLSFLPVILFPDATSKFPLYFGLGAGLGVFTKQLSGESPISLDYQLLLGARFFNLGDTNAGFFVEAGLKNHILIFSDGQFNGAFAAVGGLFTF